VLGERDTLAVDRALPAGRPVADREGGPGHVVDLGTESEILLPVPHALGQAWSPEAAGGRDDVDGLEQAGLAGAVAAEEQVPAGTGLEVERLEVAEALGVEGLEQLAALRCASA